MRLSRVDPVETRFTGSERHSNKARAVPDRAILLEEGERLHAYRLNGYLFFGSVCPLEQHLKESLNSAERPLCLLLDFAAVSGFDFSAVNVLCRFLRAAHAAGVRVVLSAASDALSAGIAHNLSADIHADLHTEPNLDRALERCEEIVIAAWRTDEKRADERRASLLEHAGGDLDRYLERQIDFESLLEQLHPWIIARGYESGAAMKGPGAPGDGVQLLTSGRASGYDGAGSRLNQYGPGDVVWPPGTLHERASSVIADEPCRTILLTPDARVRLERQDAPLALKLYRYLLGTRAAADSATGD